MSEQNRTLDIGDRFPKDAVLIERLKETLFILPVQLQVVVNH